MTRSLLYVTFLILMVSAPCLAKEDAELLTNGTFETWEDGFPTGWTISVMANEGEGTTSLVAPGEGREGTGSSLSLSGDSATKRWQAASQEFAVEPGTRVILSGWIRTEDVDPEGHRFTNCQITLVALSSEGQRMGIWALGRATGTNDWTYYEQTVQVPQGATKLIVAPFLTMSGTAWFDDISLTGTSLDLEEDATRDEKWRADLAYFVDSLAELHVEPFARISEDEFRTRAADLESRIPDVTDLEVTLGLMALAASLGDAHTAVHPGGGRERMPFQMENYDGGIRIVLTERSCETLLGGRVVRLGEVAIEEALQRVADYLSHENRYWLEHQAPRMLRFVDMLEGLEISEVRGELDVTVVDAKGDEVTCTVKIQAPDVKPEWVFTEPEGGDPWYLTAQGPYQFRYIEDARLFHLKYNQCRDDPDRPMAEFTTEVLAALDSLTVDRFVLDLRHNSGGSSQLLDGIIAGVAERRQDGRVGPCFVVTGPRTFSSATLNALDFQGATDALIVGEPMGNKPNHFGQVNAFELPYSRLRVGYSTKRFHRVEGDPPTVMPDIPAPNTWEDYQAGRDPALDAILAWEGK